MNGTRYDQIVILSRSLGGALQYVNIYTIVKYSGNEYLYDRVKIYMYLQISAKAVGVSRRQPEGVRGGQGFVPFFENLI